jgi:hypothetical protein
MRTTPRITVVMALAFCLVLTIATAAGAKFTSHNGADLTQTDVVQGSEFNTCGDRISGLIGWGTTLTLEQLGGSLPPEATGPADYEVFRFPPGANPQDYSAVFDPNTGEVLRYELVVGGTVVDIAPKILTFTSGNRVAIPGGPIEQPTDFDPTVIEYIYTSVPFAQTISPAAPIGATLAIKPAGGAALRLLTVVACTTPPTDVVASIDAQPGLSVNKVKVTSGLPTLVILVKGSATFNVTKITSASVGAALPVKSGIFKALSTPVDLTGDGRKDRLYFFRPNQTGLTCSSTSVTIGGSLSSGAHWSGTDTVKPVGC